MTSKITTLVLCLLLASACVRNRALPAGSIALVDKGNFRCAVVMGEKFSLTEKHAAEELCFFLGKVTGAWIAPTNAPQADKYSIWLGTPETCPAIAKLGALKDVQALSDQGFLIRSDERGLLIAGKTPLGVLYGVYAFLEEHVGMRWFFPGEDGEYCPSKPTLEIGRIDEKQNPAFKERVLGLGNTAVNAKMTNTWDWAVRNRMQLIGFRPEHKAEFEKRGGAIPKWGGHIMFALVPDSLFDTHPEYFALIDGTRRKQLSPNGRFMSQPCTSNPEVIEMSAKRVIKYFKEHPDGQFTLINNDCGGWCQCTNCVAQDPPEERKANRVSTRFTIYANEVFKRVYRECPNACVKMLAYQNFQMPPANVRPDPRIIIMICDHYRCYRHSLPDPSCQANKWFRNMFESWAKTGNPRGIFNYYCIYAGETSERTAGILCAPLEYIVADDLRYMYRLGHTEWSMSTIPPDGDYRHSNGVYNSPRNKEFWRANLLAHYVQAKLAWNPDLDVDALMKDLNAKFYGPAADAIERYQALARKLWKATPGDFIYGSSYGAIGKSVESPAAIKALSDLLDEAEKAAAGDPVVLKRIAKDKDIFKEGWLKAREQYIKRQSNDVRAARITAPITVDGKLEEADWGTCERVSGFIRADGAAAKVQTAVRLLYDGENLYAGLEMDEPEPEQLVAKTKERDNAKIWDGNTVELFVDPDGDGKRYVHMAINSIGALRDSECKPGAPTIGEVNFNTDAQVVSLIGTNKWIVEMKVSAKSLGGSILDGGRWMMNVGRVRQAGQSEVSSWMDGSFHDSSSFRGVAFIGPIIANGGFEDTVTLDSAALIKRYGAGTWKFGNTPPLAPKNWQLHYAGGRMATVLTEGAYAGKQSLQIDGGIIMNDMTVMMKEGAKLRISFVARGKGKITVNIYHYSIDPGNGAQSIFKVTKVGELELTPEWKPWALDYVHPAGYPQIMKLAIGIDGQAAIDEVTAVPVR